MPSVTDDRITITLATDRDREVIYRIRHDIYARELHQHQIHTSARLTDALE